ncbi:DUF4352 domain-containing protein [Microbacterium sp. JZ70]
MSHSPVDPSSPQLPAPQPSTPPPAPFGAPPAPGAAAPDPLSVPSSTGEPRPPRNTVALVALALAVVGAVFAGIPGALVVGWILLPIAFILAIVSLFQKGRKAAGVAALIVSVVGTVIGVVVFVGSLAAAVGSAVEESTSTSVASPAEEAAVEEEPAEEPAADEPVAEPAPAEGTRENPAPLGSAVSGDEWTVTVNSVTLGATDAVLAENMINQPPAEGEEYILVGVTATYTGQDEGMAAEVQIEYVTPDGVSIAGYDTIAVAPDALDTLATLYSGAQVTGNVVLAVPSATAASGLIAVTPGLFADTAFVAVQ